MTGQIIAAVAIMVSGVPVFVWALNRENARNERRRAYEARSAEITASWRAIADHVHDQITPALRELSRVVVRIVPVFQDFQRAMQAAVAATNDLATKLDDDKGTA